MRISNDIPSQDDIMSNWHGSLTVSVCCLTYNHVDYIRDALDGFIRQRTNFPFEIIVHDDASTDGTADVVRAYADAYPALIVPILQRENLHSRGGLPGVVMLRRASAPFLAFCEGDDFWTDPEKISKQVTVLRSRPEIDLCSHAILSDREARSGARKSLSSSCEQNFGLREVISKEFDLTPTVSIMIRRAAALRFAEYVEAHRELPFGDLYLKFFGTLRGGGVFINRPMGFYRRYSVGSWSARSAASYEMRLRDSSALMKSYKELDQISEGRVHSVFMQDIRDRFHHLAKDKRVPFHRRFLFVWRNRELLPFKLWLRALATLFYSIRYL